MANIPRRQYLTEKMDTSRSNAGNDLKLAGQTIKGVARVVDHAVRTAAPFAAAVRGTENDNAAADFVRDITGINNQFAVNDMMGNAKIQATKLNDELQKKYADNPTDPNFQKELDAGINDIFNAQTKNIPLSSNLQWQTTRQSTIQQFKQSNQRWAEQQSVNNLNRRIKKLNEDANNRANFYGESDNLDEFWSDNVRTRSVLENLAADFRMSPEQTSQMLSAFDVQQAYNYLKGLALKDPAKVDQILKNNDAIALMIGEKGRADLRRAFKAAKTASGEDMQKIKDLDLAIPSSWGQDKIDALNKRTDELIQKGYSIGAARKAAIQEFKEADKEYQNTLKAVLDMPSNWGQVTRDACAAYAEQLMKAGLSAPDAYKQAIKEFKDRESTIREEYEAELRDVESKGGRPSDRLAELRKTKGEFEGKTENMYGDESTFADWYARFKDEDTKPTAEDLNKAGFPEDFPELAVRKVDDLIAKGMSKEEAISQVFHEFDYTKEPESLAREYGVLSDEALDDIALSDTLNILDRDLRQHINKGYQIKNLENKLAQEQAMYDEFEEFTKNPSEPYIQARKAKPEYYLDPKFKKQTDAMEKWYKNRLQTPQNSEAHPNETTVNPQEIFDSISLLTTLQDKNPPIEDLFVAYYNDLAKMYEKGTISTEDMQAYDIAARHVVMDKTFARNMAYLANYAKDYFPASKFRNGSASGLTRKELENVVNREQARAFTTATRMIVQDQGDPTRAAAYYKEEQDNLYKRMLMRAHIDLDALETKRINKEPAIFYLNGVPQKYLGRDDFGNIISEDAWEVLPAPDLVKPNPKKEGRQNALEVGELRMPGFTKFVVAEDSEKLPGLKGLL